MTALLERETQVAVLEDALDRVSGGRREIVIVEGDAGLGKSSLLRATAELARERGLAVRAARSGALERELVRGVAHQLSDPGSRGGGPGGPAAVLVDDAHWSDDASLGWLRQSMQDETVPPAPPVLLVLAIAPGEPATSATLASLAASAPSTVIALSALSPGGTRTLLERAYGRPVDAEFNAACHRWTGGNPLFVTEVASHLVADGVPPTASCAPLIPTLTPPDGLSRMLLLRLARLGQAAVQLARAVALLGSAAAPEASAALAGLSADDLPRAVAELADARVLTGAHAGALEFVHPLIARVVYEDLLPARRAAMHKRAAHLLAEAGSDPGLVAAHLRQTTPARDAWVASALGAAAEADLDRGSPGPAVALLRRACDEPAPPSVLPRLLAALGRAESLIGDPAGIATLEAAVTASPSPAERAELERHRARLQMLSGAIGDLPVSTGRGEAIPAAAMVARARRALHDGTLIGRGSDAPEAWMGAIHALAIADELPEADAAAAHALQRAADVGSRPAYSVAVGLRALIAHLSGRLGDAEHFAREALRAAGGLRVLERWATDRLALVLVDRGAADEALAVVSGDSDVAFGRALIEVGRTAEGVSALLEGGGQTEAAGSVGPAWSDWRAEAALALHGLGDAPRARRLSEENVKLAQEFGAGRTLGVALRTDGLIRGGERGLVLLVQAVDILALSPARLEHARTLVELGAALRRANRRAQARGPLDQGRTIAEACGARGLARQAGSELAATEARPRSILRDGVEALTPSERRVCELAAAGHSNAEIAGALFVSRSTIESHLHSAYSKLDITSRGRLADVLSA